MEFRSKNELLFILIVDRTCPRKFVKCADGIQCIRPSDFCDGYAACKDESDEDPIICVQGRFMSVLSM